MEHIDGVQIAARTTGVVSVSEVQLRQNMHVLCCSLQRIEDDARMRFGDSSRLREVCRMLRSSRPIFFRVDRPPEMADHDFEQRKQAKLLLSCTRSCATVLGRAMLTLGSLPQLRTLAEHLPVGNRSRHIPWLNTQTLRSGTQIEPGRANATF